jgi:dephospho-CoA kinase
MTISQDVDRAALLRRLDDLHASFDRRALTTWAEPLLSTSLTMQQLKVLTLVAADGDRATGHDLAETLHVSVATMSGLVDRLVEHEMVQRRDDPTDRRIRRLSVTARGTATLRALILADKTVLDRLNAAVHPLVAQDRAAFIQTNQTAEILLLDVPLLYEIGLDQACDAVAVVSAPAEIQRQRVLDRGAMTEAEFQTILARQLPDAEKRKRATYVIPTTSLEAAAQAVKEVLADIRRTHHA